MTRTWQTLRHDVGIRCDVVQTYVYRRVTHIQPRRRYKLPDDQVVRVVLHAPGEPKKKLKKKLSWALITRTYYTSGGRGVGFFNEITLLRK